MRIFENMNKNISINRVVNTYEKNMLSTAEQSTGIQVTQYRIPKMKWKVVFIIYTFTVFGVSRTF